MNFIKNIVKYFLRRFSIARLKRAVKQPGLRIVVGSSGFHEKGWVPTDIDYLNMLNDADWKSFFEPGSIDAILGEHVWEHLSEEDGITAFKNCFKYLKSGGYLRVAVPDGYNPRQEYIDFVKPGGSGEGAHDHKILYNYHTMTIALRKAGFRVDLLEYYDEERIFNQLPWKREDGYIKRSKDFDPRNANGELKYTSLIVDAVKP